MAIDKPSFVTSAEPVRDVTASDFLHAFHERVILPLVERTPRGGGLRFWVPAAADVAMGPCLAAMTSLEIAHADKAMALRVFVTDRRREVLRTANRAEIPRPLARQLLRLGCRAQLEWEHGRWTLEAEVRNHLMVSSHNPLAHAPFANIDFLYARDVLNAYPATCVNCLSTQLLLSLSEDAFVFTGMAQSVVGNADLLTPVEGVPGLFRVASASQRASSSGSQRRRRSLVPCQPTAQQMERAAMTVLEQALIVDAEGTVRGEIGPRNTLISHPTQPWHRSLGVLAKMPLRSALLNAFVGAVRKRLPTWCSLRADEDQDFWVSAHGMPPSNNDHEPLFLLRLIRYPKDALGTAEEPSIPIEVQDPLVATVASLKQVISSLNGQKHALANANARLSQANAELSQRIETEQQALTEMETIGRDNEELAKQMISLRADLKNLERSVDIGVLVLDRKLRVHRFNDAATAVIPLRKSDLKKALDLDVVPAGLRPPPCNIERTAEVGESYSWTAKLDDGRGYFAKLLPYRLEGHQIGGAVLTFVDITELESSRAELENQNAALRRANEDLERFAYVASHDLKSPLRSVRTMLEFLREDLNDQMSPESTEHLQLVTDRVLRMERMVQDLLAYSRLGRQAGDLVQVDCDELIREQIGLLDLPPAFQFEVATDGLQIITFPTLLTQVIRNLAENAVTHHDRETGTIRVSVRREDDRCVEIEVADDGPGIPERHQERIFEIFQKTTERSSGSGMGLALVKKAVVRAGGTISVHSHDGERGTAFRIHWPVDRVITTEPEAAVV